MKVVDSPDGIPCDGAVLLNTTIYLVPDDAVLIPTATILESFTALAAVMIRNDLDAAHPLHGTRAMVSVPAGSGDLVMNGSGVIEPA